MVRRELLDAYLRDRAATSGATIINGLFVKMEKPQDKNAPYVLHYIAYNGNKPGSTGEKTSIEVDAVIGADGANSRVAKSIDVGEYEYAIAYQERIKIPADKMAYYENLDEMYNGDDVSPDFYGWVFTKCDHVAVGTGTMKHKNDIKRLQSATHLRAHDKIYSRRKDHTGGSAPSSATPAAMEGGGEGGVGGRCGWICNEMWW